MVKSIDCDMCGKQGFKKVSAMKAHKRIVHGGHPLNPGVTPAQKAGLSTLAQVKQAVSDPTLLAQVAKLRHSSDVVGISANLADSVSESERRAITAYLADTLYGIKAYIDKRESGGV